MLLWTELTIEYQLIGKLHRVQRLSRRMCMLQQQQQQQQKTGRPLYYV